MWLNERIGRIEPDRKHSIATDKHLEHILEKKSTKSMGGGFPHLEHAQTHT